MTVPLIANTTTILALLLHRRCSRFRFMGNISDEPIDPLLTCQGIEIGKCYHSRFLMTDVAQNCIASIDDIQLEWDDDG